MEEKMEEKEKSHCGGGAAYCAQKHHFRPGEITQFENT